MKAFAIEIRYAFFISAATLIWLMLEYLLGLQDEYVQYHSVITMFSLIIPIAFTFVALRKKRDEYYEGVITFRQAFVTGMLITMMCAVLVIPIQLMFHYSINPHFFDVMIEEHVKQAINKGKNLTEAYQQAQAYFNINAYIVQSVIRTLVIGTVLSAILGWGVKRSEAEWEVWKQKRNSFPTDNLSE